jgi:uncharacterized membrane protein
MICSYCSVEMPDISAFCPGCRRSVNALAEPAPEEQIESGIRERLLATLAYMAALPAIVFLALPSLKTSRFVRFHSWQSVLFVLGALLLAGVTRVLFAIFSVIPVIGFLFSTLLAGLVALALVMIWCVLVVKTLQGKNYELPLMGPWAAVLAG